MVSVGFGSTVSAAIKSKTSNAKDTVKVTSVIPNNKRGKNRNVMMNAENTTGPRNINIGLPLQVISSFWKITFQWFTIIIP